MTYWKNLSQILKLLKGIWSGFSLKEKSIILILFFIPVIISVLNILMSIFIPDILSQIPISNYTIYLLFFGMFLSFLISSALVTLPTLISYKNRNMQKKNWSVLEILTLLIKKRNITKKEIFTNICSLIAFFYIHIFLLVTIIHYSLLDMVVFGFYLFILFLFSTYIYYFFSIFLGFQDGSSNKILVSLVSLPYIIYFLLFAYPKIIEFPINFEQIDPAMKTFQQILYILIFPIIIAFLKIRYSDKQIGSKKSIFYREQRYEKKGWNKFFITKAAVMANAIPIFVLSFFYGFFSIAILVENFDIVITVNEFLLYCFVFISIGAYLGFLLLRPFFITLLDKLYDWKDFFRVYNGSYSNDTTKINQLIKISGCCLSLTNSNKFRNIVPDFDQQFKIVIDRSNEEIDVIRSKERTPFSESLDIVQENDHIKVLGKIKNIYDDSQESYKILIGYHIELMK